MSAASFLRRLLGGGRGGADGPVPHLFRLCDALIRESGEYTSTALAREALDAFDELDAAARDEFFDILARDYSPSPDEVAQSALAYQSDPSPANLAQLFATVEPPRQELFRRLNMAPGGTAALVEMRKDLLRNLRSRPHWAVIDADLMHLLRSWFNRGFLRQERIDWRTPAIVLEKLIEYEAVHAIQGWRDLRRRLEADRRCFAFFHPQLPDEPIIFIEVALTRSMSAHIQPLLDIGAPVSAANCDCAMFYSITNCQEGLRGISFGNLLIKQVAEELKREFPHLRRFATLSPLQGFRRWVEQKRVERPKELTALSKLDQPDWHLGEVPDALQRMLMRLCAYYLLHAKHGDEPVDPVARFHLGNGARIERLNWLGDTSPKGMAESAGLMVNYLYRLEDIEANHEAFASGGPIAASSSVKKLAAGSPAVKVRG